MMPIPLPNVTRSKTNCDLGIILSCYQCRGNLPLGTNQLQFAGLKSVGRSKSRNRAKTRSRTNNEIFSSGVIRREKPRDQSNFSIWGLKSSLFSHQLRKSRKSSFRSRERQKKKNWNSSLSPRKRRWPRTRWGWRAYCAWNGGRARFHILAR